MRFLLTCGGSAGHINPALAVAGLLRSEGHEVLFVGAPTGLENKLVPREGFDIKTVAISSLAHSLSPKAIMRNVKVLTQMGPALHKAKKIVEEFKPDAALGTGGYASFPPLRAAAKLGIPVLIHESNAIPGITTRSLADKAAYVLVGMETCRKAYKDQSKVRVVGTPVRKDFFNRNRVLSREALGVDNRPLIASILGSQGARDVNNLMLRLFKLEAENGQWQHIHATGATGYGWMIEKASELGIDFKENPHIRMEEYLFNMPDIMAGADLMICRAGASTLAELCAAGCPAVLIPSPNVAADHQTANAKALEATGGAVVLTEDGLDEKNLYDTIDGLLRSREKLDEMSVNLRKAAVENSAGQIRDLLYEVARKKALH